MMVIDPTDSSGDCGRRWAAKTSVRCRHAGVWSLWTAVFVMAGLSARAAAAQPDGGTGGATPPRPTFVGSYCGVNCLYILLRACDEQVQFTSLLRHEYIGSQRGSSFAELRQAARDHDLHARIVENLSTSQLRRSPYPMILHLRGDPGWGFDHFVLYLGTQGDAAYICDPPKPITLMPFYRLAPHWDGTALAVSTEPVVLHSTFFPARWRSVGSVLLAVVFIAMVHRVRPHLPAFLSGLAQRRPLRASAGVCVAIGLVALLCGLAHHSLRDDGFLAHPDAIVPLQQTHARHFIPKVHARRIPGLLDKGAVFVDARRRMDYGAGHLHGAMNIPVDATDEERRNVMACTARKARIIVYCQSAGCRFAERVALQLREDGFSNVSVFPGGWSEWQSRRAAPQRARE